MTLKAGIERMIFEELPEVTEVLDTTDHGVGHEPLLRPVEGLTRPAPPGILARGPIGGRAPS